VAVLREAIDERGHAHAAPRAELGCAPQQGARPPARRRWWCPRAAPRSYGASTSALPRPSRAPP
jgi:hypothetical protein